MTTPSLDGTAHIFTNSASATVARSGSLIPIWGREQDVIDYRITKLGLLKPGERFVYIFDFGDDWTHLCTVGDERFDPAETLGIVPARPLPYSGWGDIPDQYGRRWDGDNGESHPPADPGDDDAADIEH